MTSLFLGNGLGGGPNFTGSGGADDSTVDAVFVSLPESEVSLDGLVMSRTANHRS